MARSVLTWLVAFGMMSALAYFLKQQSPDFVEGAACGMMGTALLIYIAHKLDIRLF